MTITIIPFFRVDGTPTKFSLYSKEKINSLTKQVAWIELTNGEPSWSIYYHKIEDWQKEKILAQIQFYIITKNEAFLGFTLQEEE